jgi:hypothetical protein
LFFILKNLPYSIDFEEHMLFIYYIQRLIVYQAVSETSSQKIRCGHGGAGGEGKLNGQAARPEHRQMQRTVACR